ncbi:MAG: hypothetical protein ABH814_01320 [bacterium]
MSLKNTQYQIKRTAALIALTFVTYYTGKYALKGTVALYKFLNPPPPPGPTLAFGKIPHPEIKGVEFDNGEVTYQLDTVNGALPQLPPTLTVFEVDDPEPDLLSGTKARNLAVSLGFKSQAKELSKTEYLWEEGETTRQFKINIASGNFTLTTDGKTLNQKLKAGDTYSEIEAVTRAKGMLSGKGLLPETLEQGIQKTTLVAVDENGNPHKTPSLSTAQLVKVDFYRNLPVDKAIYPVFGQKKLANVTVYLTGTREQEIEAPLIYYTTWNPVQETQATYPAKPVDLAWQEVQEGQAPVVELRIKDADPFAEFKKLAVEKVFVREVYLAYFEDKEIQDFMIPIYVFEGEALTTDNQRAYFTAFSWAIDNEWLRD